MRTNGGTVGAPSHRFDLWNVRRVAGEYVGRQIGSHGRHLGPDQNDESRLASYARREGVRKFLTATALTGDAEFLEARVAIDEAADDFVRQQRCFWMNTGCRMVRFFHHARHLAIGAEAMNAQISLAPADLFQPFVQIGANPPQQERYGEKRDIGATARGDHLFTGQFGLDPGPEVPPQRNPAARLLGGEIGDHRDELLAAGIARVVR